MRQQCFLGREGIHIQRIPREKSYARTNLYRGFVKVDIQGEAGVYKSIKTHPRQAPARKDARKKIRATEGVNVLIMSYRDALVKQIYRTPLTNEHSLPRVRH